MGVSFPQLPSPQQPVIDSGGAPNPLMLLLQSFQQAVPMGAQSYQETANREQRASSSSAELDLQHKQLDFQIAQEKTKQEMLKAHGGAMQMLLERLAAPAQAETGPMGTPMHYGGFGGAGGAPGQPWSPGAGGPPPQIQQAAGAMGQPVAGPGPNPQWMQPPAPPAQSGSGPYAVLSQIMKGMSPEAAADFVKTALPMLKDIEKTTNEKGQAVQTGEMVTTFVPGKGFWDPQANGGKGGYVQSVERGLSADQKRMKDLDFKLQEERIGQLQDYRAAVRGQVQTNQFNTRTKDLRDRGRMIQQAILTIHDAQTATNPNDRKVLTSSAIANFVQAADQKAQLRYQMLQYFKKNIDPSFTGGLQNMASLIRQGTYPDRVYQGMAHHLVNLLAQSRSEYEKQRTGEIKRHPELNGLLPEADEFFTSDMPSATPKGGGGLDMLIPPPS